MPLQFGAHSPTSEIGNDPGVIREYAQALEAAGYDYIETYDHVLGVDRNRPPRGFTGAHDSDDAFHEPFVLFAYLAAVTQRLGFATGSLTCRSARRRSWRSRLRSSTSSPGQVQARRRGRLEPVRVPRAQPGLPHPWPPHGGAGHAAARALGGADAELRGARFHRVPYAGINPRPACAIPIWMGGGAERVVDRIGRIADGWIIPTYEDAARMQQQIPRIRETAEADAGRDLSGIGFSVVVRSADGARATVERALEWEAAGVTHLAVGIAGSGHLAWAGHLDTLRAVIEEYRSRC